MKEILLKGSQRRLFSGFSGFSWTHGIPNSDSWALSVKEDHISVQIVYKNKFRPFNLSGLEDPLVILTVKTLKAAFRYYFSIEYLQLTIIPEHEFFLLSFPAYILSLFVNPYVCNHPWTHFLPCRNSFKFNQKSILPDWVLTEILSVFFHS